MKKRKMAALVLAFVMILSAMTLAVPAAQVNYGEEYTKHGYTFTINGVHITEAGYYTLEGLKVEETTEGEVPAGAAVQVTDPVNKKIKMVNGTAYSQFHNVFEWEHTAWEKEAVGVYIAGKKVTATGYYNNDGTEASENGPVHVDVENKKITLNNADISLTTSEMTLLEQVPDQMYYNQNQSYITDVYDGVNGVPGVLVITEGTYRIHGSGVGGYNWDGFYYWPIGYNTNYAFGSIGIGIMADDELNTTLDDWTMELSGENTITVNNSFAMPQQLPSSGREHLLDAAAYGVFAESNLNITGTGSLSTVVNNNWNFLEQGYMNYNGPNTVSGIWTNGNLSITSGTIAAETSSTEFEEGGITMTGMNRAAAIGAGGNLTISGEDTSVTVTETTLQGTALRGGTGVTISDKATVAATSASSVAGVAIMGGTSKWNGKEVTISGGASVTATTTSDVMEYADGIGIAGGEVTVSDATLDVNAEGAGITSGIISITSGTVDVSVSSENGTAIEADQGEIAVGTFNTPVDSELIADTSVIVNDTVLPKEELSEYVARIGNTYYTGEDGGAKAIRDMKVGQKVYLNTDTSEGRDDFALGDTFTLMVAEGKAYTGTVTGPGVRAEITEGNQEEFDGVLYTEYTFTMVVDPERAGAKVVLADGTETYYRDLFGSNGAIDSFSNPLPDGATVVVLQNTEVTSSYTENVSFTLDLNGKTITINARNTSNGLMIEGKADAPVSVKIIDSSEKKTGKLENIWSATSTVGVTVCAKQYAEVTVEGGTFSGRTEASGGTLTLDGGKYIGEIVAGADSKVIVTEKADITDCEAYSNGGVLILPGEIGGDCSSTESDSVRWKILNADDENPTMGDLEAGTCKLIISGTGAMKNYRESYSDIAPWRGYGNAFSKIIVEEGVTTIGQYAFFGMTGFELIIPDSLTKILGNAFEGAQITTYNIGTSAAPFPAETVFDTPMTVQRFSVADDNTAYKCVDGALFSKDGITLYKASVEVGKNYVIPEGTQIIKPMALSDIAFDSVHFPSTYVGAQANPNPEQSLHFYALPKTTISYNGAVFGGWYNNAAFETHPEAENDQNGDPVYRVWPEETAGDGLTVYAKWGYEITYNSGNGETKVVVPSGKLLKDFAPNVGIDGKTLLGWSATEGGTADDTLTASAAATVYAVWEEDASFEANYNGITLEAIEAVTYTGEAFTPKVYYTDADGNRRQVAESEVEYENNINAGTATVKVKNTDPVVSTTFTINKAKFSAVNYGFKGKTSIAYDGELHSLTLNKELPEGVSVSITYDDEAVEGVRDVKRNSSGGVTSYQVKAVFTLNDNFEFENNYNSTKQKTTYFYINPVEVTVTPDDATMYRGETLPALTYTVTAPDGITADITTEPVLTTTASGLNAGNFVITASGAVVNNDTNNYEVVYEEGLLTVGIKVLDAGVSFANDTVTYDTENHNITVAVDGTLPESFSIAYTVNGEPFTGAVNAGTYEVTASFSCTDPAYDPVEPLTATLVINPALVTVTADDKTMTAKKNMPEFTYTVEGLLGEDELTIEPVCSCETDGNSAGTYDIVVDGEPIDGSGNYTIEYVSGTLTVKTAYRKPSSGNLSSTAGNTSTKTETEVTTNPDGSTVTTETKADGTVTTVEKDTEGNTVTTVENPDGSTSVTEQNKDGSEAITETASDGTIMVTETDADGNSVKTIQKTDGNTVTITVNSGVTVTTETIKDGGIYAEIILPSEAETEIVIPVQDADAIGAVIVTDENGIETEITDYKVTENGVVIMTDRNCTVEIRKEASVAEFPFIDVEKDFWGYEGIAYCYENGIMNGMADDTFEPETVLSRAMVTTMLYRLAGEPEVETEGTEWYDKARAWAMENGISDGTSMENTITREQFVTMLYRYADAEKADVATLGAFTDSDAISEYAKEAVAWATANAIMNGMGDGTVAPQASATRAQAAAIFMRFAELTK